MKNFDVEKRTILLTRHGSRAYGLATPTSDEDFKGVCVKPRSHYLGYLSNFEQAEHMGSKNDGVDKVIYSLDKFVRLAVDCNPNIIEVLHVDDDDVLVCDEFGEELLSKRNDFLSKKAKHTFSGYAHAQLKRIKSRRALFTQPPPTCPIRDDFELTQDYQLALERWNDYQSWLKNRNPARAELEVKHGFDTKHGSHLIRLMRMCLEILEGRGVIVKRPDREELLAIKMGQMTYDELIEEAEDLERRCDELYVSSSLRKELDRESIDAWLVDMTGRYLTKHG